MLLRRTACRTIFISYCYDFTSVDRRDSVTAHPLQSVRRSSCYHINRMPVIKSALRVLASPSALNSTNNAASCLQCMRCVQPAYEATVAPLPNLCSPERPAAFKPMRYGDYLERKVLSNFELEPR